MTEVMTLFPASIVRVLSDNFTRVPTVDPNSIFKRPLLPIDPTRSIGVYATDWMPGQMQIGQMDPGTATYNLRVEGLIKHADQAEGLTEHSVFSRHIRSMLYRDTLLRAELALTDTTFDVIERLKDWRVLTQRFMTGESSGTYQFFSYMDVSFHMEQTRLN
jgi:hypothetical protein